MFGKAHIKDMNLYPLTKPDNTSWNKEDGWKKYLTYNQETEEYKINTWRDDLQGKWYWVHDGVTHWKELE